MNKISKLIYSSVAVCFAATGIANAEVGKNYLRADLGAGFLGKVKNDRNWVGIKKDKNAFYYGLNYGYQLHDNFRGELSVSRLDGSKVKASDATLNYSQKFDSTVLLLKGYVDFPVYEATKLYVVAGGGISFNKSGNYNASNGKFAPGATKENGAWLIGVGANYMVSDALSVDLQYNYLNLGKVQPAKQVVSNVVNYASFKASSHVVSIGWSYHY